MTALKGVWKERWLGRSLKGGGGSCHRLTPLDCTVSRTSGSDSTQCLEGHCELAMKSLHHPVRNWMVSSSPEMFASQQLHQVATAFRSD